MLHYPGKASRALLEFLALLAVMCPPKKLLKFGADGQEFAKFYRSLEQFIQTVKG